MSFVNLNVLRWCILTSYKLGCGKSKTDSPVENNVNEMAGNLMVPSADSEQRLNAALTMRPKVALLPGRSLMDWIRLGKSGGKDLTGVGKVVQNVTLMGLAQHNTKEDAWTAIRGKVYNLTPYLEYHPGGQEELMRGAGIDATELFDSIHKWVNAESMLNQCYVGKLTDEPGLGRPKPFRQNGVLVTSDDPKAQALGQPRYQWYQDTDTVTIAVYTSWYYIHPEMVTIDKHCSNTTIRIAVRTQEHTFRIHWALLQDVTTEFKVEAFPTSGRVEITLQKCKPGLQWKVLGKPLAGDTLYTMSWKSEIIWRQCTVRKVVRLNYNTKMLRILIPEGSRVPVPIGHHLQIKFKIDGFDLTRNYTTVLPSLLQECQDPDMEKGKVLYFMIKIYEDGAMTPHIDALKKGDLVTMSDSMGTFCLSKLKGATHLVCIAAGTGITATIRIIYHVLYELPADQQMKVHLVFYNRTLADLIWMAEFDDLAEAKSNFNVTHVLTQEKQFGGMKGRISKEHLNELINLKHIQEFVPKPSKEALHSPIEGDTTTDAAPDEKEGAPTDFVKPVVVVCGSLGFSNIAKSLLQQHGLTDENIFIFP